LPLALVRSLIAGKGVTTTRHWRPAWLLVSVLGVLVAFRAARDSMPPCDCFEWRYLVMVADLVVLPFAIAVVLVIAGLVGSLGLLDGLLRFAGGGVRRAADVWRVAQRSPVVERFTRSGKVRWACGLAALLWSPVFLYGCALALRPPTGAPSPTFSNATIGAIVMFGALPAFVVTALVLWLLMYVVATLRRFVARQPDQTSS
jgi:hypothetical protein